MDDGGWLGHTELGGDVIGDPSGSVEIEEDDDLSVPPYLTGGSVARPSRILRIGRLQREAESGQNSAEDLLERASRDVPTYQEMRRWMRGEVPNDGERRVAARRRLGTTVVQPHRMLETMMAAPRRFGEERTWDPERQRLLSTRQELLEAALARETGPRPPQAIIDMDQRVPEDLIDALAQHAAMANRSYTTPTNSDSIRRLQGFVPQVVGSTSSIGSGESSRTQSPFITPLPTMPGGRLTHKRRRAATLTRDHGELSRYCQALTLSQQLATLPALPNDRLPAYMRISNAHISAVPTELNDLDRCERITLSCCKTGPEALIATFSGDGEGGDDDAAAVRADRPIPRGAGIYYYEAEVISIGVSGYIAIGLCNRYTNLQRLTGWEPDSFAWHLDDGYFFKSQGHGINMGWPKSGNGDVIGCGTDADGTLFFTKNGQFVGRGCTIPVETDLIYPAIGLRTPGECLRVNFAGPFRYDIEQRARDAQQKALAAVAGTPICISLSTQPDTQANTSTTTSRLLDMLHLLDTEDDEKPPDKKSRASPARDLGGLVRRPRVSPHREKRKAKAELKDSKAEELVPAARVKKSIADIDTPLGAVVLDYLKHSGFAKTTAALGTEMQQRKAQRMTGISNDDILTSSATMAPAEDDLGVKIRLLMEAGYGHDIGEVVRILKAGFSSFWTHESEGCRYRGAAVGLSNWAFRIHLIALLHLIQAAWKGDTDLPGWAHSLFWDAPAELDGVEPKREVLDAAQRFQHMYSGIQDQAVKSVVEDAFSLLVYSSLEEVPPKLRLVLTQNRLNVLADDMARSIRAHEKAPPESVLEEAYRQFKSTHQSLTSIFGIGEAAYVGESLL